MTILAVMGFRENLKDELNYQGILVKELAARTNISKHTLDHYLAQNSIAPSAENAVKIAAALGVSAEYLVTGTDPSVPRKIKPAVITVLQKIKYLSDDDLKLLALIAERMSTSQLSAKHNRQ